MVYVDKKGQRYEVQYCVVLRDGKDAGLKNYVWASEEQINHAKDIIKKQKDKNFSTERCDIPKKNTDILEIIAINEENANNLAEVLGLPKPFNNRK